MDDDDDDDDDDGDDDDDDYDDDGGRGDEVHKDKKRQGEHWDQVNIIILMMMIRLSIMKIVMMMNI